MISHKAHKSPCFHINSGDGKHGKGHEGLKLSKGILQSHSYRGSGGPGDLMGASRGIVNGSNENKKKCLL